MIIFDLEWNGGSGNGFINEILQIGAVRVNQIGGKITDTFCVYIKPSLQNEFSPPVLNLPDLQESINSSIDLPSGLSSFFQWCGNEVEFAAWGSSDFQVLYENICYCKLNYSLSNNLLDLQASFASFLHTKSRIALYKAVEYCKIPAIFSFHNALYDAVYTATLCESMSSTSLLKATYPSGLKDIQNNSSNSQKQNKRHQYGPFLSFENVLNSRCCRHPSCPTCEKIIGISHWFYSSQEHYYSKFSCPQHGEYIVHLKLSQDENSRWWGYLSVLETNQENLSTYHVVRCANSFSCIQTNYSKKRRRLKRFISKEKSNSDKI